MSADERSHREAEEEKKIQFHLELYDFLGRCERNGDGTDVKEQVRARNQQAENRAPDLSLRRLRISIF